MLFDPRFLFMLLWTAQVAGHILVSSFFEPIAIETYYAVYFASASFMIGAQMIAIGARNRKIIGEGSLFSTEAFHEWLRKRSSIIVIMYIIFAFWAFSYIASSLGADVLDFGNYDKFRIAFINDFVGARQFWGLTKIFFLGVGISLFLLSIAEKRDKFMITSALVLGCISALLTTGRLAFLIFFIGACYLLYSKKVIRMFGLLLSGIGFLFVFLVIALFMKKGSSVGNLASQLSWNILVYAFGSLSAFNHYVVFHDPVIAGGAFLPNSIRALIEPLFGAIAARPPVNPFIFIPEPTNTYTALFPIFHDLGIAGLSIYFLCLGAGHQYLYVIKQRWGALGSYLYALSLYPLVMTIFEEAYVSSPGTWLAFLSVPLLFRAWFAASHIVRSTLINYRNPLYQKSPLGDS